MGATHAVLRDSSQRSTSNLTNAQMMVWIGQQLHRDVPLYNMPLAIRIDGSLSATRLSEAFESVIARSDAMRSVFRTVDSVPQRIVVDGMSSKHGFEDLSAHSSDELDGWLQRRSERSFDLAEKLFDSVLVKLGDERHLWFLNQHHLITDGWSTANLLSKVWAAYLEIEAGGQPDEVLPAFENYAITERELRQHPAHQKAVDFWANQVPENAQLAPLYVGRKAVNRTESTRTEHQVGSDRSRLLKELSSRKEFQSLTPHLTHFNLFSTILFSLLNRLTDQSDLLIGIPSNNRGSRVFKETIGLFVELYPFAVSLDNNETFATLHRKVIKQSTTNLLKTRAGSCTPSLQRTFNVVLNYINTSLPGLPDRQVETQWLHSGHSDPGHHLRLEIHDLNETGEFHLLFDTNDEVFGAEERKWLIEHFDQTIDAILEDPNRRIQDIEFAAPNTHVSARYTTSSSRAGTIVERFAVIAAQFASQQAVATKDHSLSYRELDHGSDRIASALQNQHSIQAEDVVGIVADRSATMISAIMGILKAGASYVPVEPTHPQKRIDQLLTDSGAKLLLAPGENTTATAVPVVSLPRLLTQFQSTSFTARVNENTCAYVAYTSGSTGTPNGVQVEHGSVVSLVDALHERIYHRYDRRLNVALVAPLIFDASVQQIFAALLQGHCLCLVPESARLNAVLLSKFYDDFKIDVSDGTPSHLQLLADVGFADDSSIPSHFIIGGEKLTKKHCRQFFECASPQSPIITNVYGVAECCVDSTSFDVFNENIDEISDGVPIGKSLSNSEVFVVNQGLRRQPTNVVGNLAIGGSGVARGYLGRKELTQERFVDHPDNPGERVYLTGDLGWTDSNGDIHFIGRGDNQVKINGIRIELGEIESRLRSFSESANQSLDQIDVTEVNDSPVRCTQCLLTSFHPDVELDAAGECNVCREWSRYESAAAEYFQSAADLDRLLNMAEQERQSSEKSSDYDCMLLYSGGKDSSYVLHRLVERGLKVLAFTFDNGFISKSAFENIERQTKRLGVDSIIERTQRMNDIFVESLNTDDTVCSGCFKSLTAISTKIAHQRGINVVVTGLSRGQIFDTKLSGLYRQGILDVCEVERNLQTFRELFHANNDRTAQLLNVDLSDVVMRRIHFVDFFRYDSSSVSNIRDYLRERDEFWRQPVDTGFCSSNCIMNDVGICVHGDKRGYHNYEAPLSWDVRLGISTRDEVLPEVAQSVSRRSANKILHKIGFFRRKIQQARVLDIIKPDGSRSLVGFYTCNQPIAAKSIREFLAQSLPSYMVPTKLVQLESFPLTENGKVDDNALRNLAANKTHSPEYVAPEDGIQQTLAEIWKDVLGVTRVGANENFFDLGGDSIGAIRIVAAAHQSGLQLDAKKLLDAQTVENLAQHVQLADQRVEQSVVHGPLLLTPVQREFLSSNETIPIFTQYVRVEVNSRVQASLLGKAALQVLQHHDALRAAFLRDGGQWKAEHRDPADDFDVLVDQVGEDLEKLIADVHAKLDPEHGKHLAIGVLQGASACDEVVIAVHHLVMDAVSWPILLEDLFTSYEQLESGQEVSLPLKTTSFQAWTELLHDESNSETAIRESDDWLAECSGDVTAFPFDFEPTGPFLERHKRDFTHRIEVDTTKVLFEESKRKRYRVNEVLLAALAWTLSDRANDHIVHIDVEGHGREPVLKDKNVSRTVGWFTSIFPLMVRLANGTDPSPNDVLTCVRERMATVPQNGLFVAGRTNQKSTVLFNYLGRSDQLFPPSDRRTIRGGLQVRRAPNVVRHHRIEINAIASDDRLEFTWSYDQQCFENKTIREMSENLQDKLQRLLECIAESNGQPRTAQDFTNANLTKQSLGKLSKLLQQLEPN